MSYVYIKSESASILNIPGAKDLYTVGFYKPDGKWEPESDHATAEAAAARVHWLNGAECNHDYNDEGCCEKCGEAEQNY